MKWSGAAMESIAASRSEPSEKEKEQSRAYKEIVCSAVLKEEGHIQLEIPDNVQKHNGRRLYTVTTIASSARYGGTRTVVVCSTFERAKEIVESNEGDIFEMSYYLVVIEAVVADWLYVAIDEQYWYVWEPTEPAPAPRCEVCDSVTERHGDDCSVACPTCHRRHVDRKCEWLKEGSKGSYVPIEQPAVYVGTCGFGIG